MVNGQVDNHLWSHEAVLTRQYPISNIERVEVLYGPASAIYGPNAFLGIINVVTRDGSDLGEGENGSSVDLFAGSDATWSVDGNILGKVGQVSYSLAARVFRSDEPDLSGQWGFLKPEQFADKGVWGPILDIEHRGHGLGEYHDPTDDHGVTGTLSWNGTRLEWISWERKEAYGPYYAADRAQNNGFWNKAGTRTSLSLEEDLRANLKSRSSLSYRKSRTWGVWAEASPDGEDSSFVSSTLWNSVSNSYLFKQQFEVDADEVTLMGGLKFERKELTKAYDVPGYWDAFSSSTSAPGPLGYGAAIAHSRDATYVTPPPPSRDMPPDNLALTRDLGGFVQAIWDRSPFRFHAGLRYDHNSTYGSSVNPRMSGVYRFSPKGALKLVYGEAFQEPAPIQLWGGWNGRLANPELKPEKARNLEAIAMYQTERVSHDASLFFSHYQNVIKEEAANTGTRDIRGFEYRGRFTMPNVIAAAPDISGFLFYSFTNVTSSTRFNHAAGEWEDKDTDLGDIAPHKINAGINVPAGRHWNLNLRANFVSKRKLYSRNPLRARGRTLDPYIVLNGTVSYCLGGFDLTIKVGNILDHSYFHPGVEQADSGDDFNARSRGFRNSLIPQPGRSVMLGLSIDY